MEIKEGYMNFLGFKTYYRIVNPNGKKTPLVILHGGPGSTHNFFEIFDHFAFEDDRPLVMYDQIGCGKSLVEGSHKELWKKETWVDELIALRKELNLDKIHLLGHSWGGMLNIIYNCDYHPEGIKSMILSSTLSSASLWKEETHRLVNEMEAKYRDALLKAEQTHNFSSKAYEEAYDEYSHKHIYGPFIVGKDPECITRIKPKCKETYVTSWGDSEFSPSGTLKDYEYTDKLHLIQCPVLLCSGLYDESTPKQNEVMLNNIVSKKHWELFTHSRHCSYYEEHEKYCALLKQFLNDND
jgi:proline iminopeptidase